jgi:hypothetical protein
MPRNVFAAVVAAMASCRSPAAVRAAVPKSPSIGPEPRPRPSAAPSSPPMPPPGELLDVAGEEPARACVELRARLVANCGPDRETTDGRRRPEPTADPLPTAAADHARGSPGSHL